MAEDWTNEEVEAIIRDYLEMLREELAGHDFNKSARRRALQAKLVNRNHSSIERKHMNISAAMRDLGMPTIRGYKPYPNYQRLIAQRLVELLPSASELHSIVRESVDRKASFAAGAVSGLTFQAPPSRSVDEERPEEALRTYDISGGKFDYLANEARNRSLGEAGERLVVEFERSRLLELGEANLAKKVEQVSQTRGDGLGFDVLSFEPGGGERLIEVKTTAFHERTPFFLTHHELEVSRRREHEYFLYRVFNFHRKAGLFNLPGRIERHCSMSPTVYLARF